MAVIALEQLEFAATRKKEQLLLRIFNPTEKSHGYQSSFTIIEMVNDDMPFLVDSVSAAIARQDLAVHITVHPVIRVVRDGRGRLKSIQERSDKKGKRESFVRFAIDRETNPQQLKLLEHEITKVLADVRTAVRDWPAMREKMKEARESLKNGPPGVDEEMRDESRALLDWMVDDRFTFLGYREYRLSKRGKQVFLNAVPGSGLGLLSREERGGGAVELTREMRRLTRSKDWLIIAGRISITLASRFMTRKVPMSASIASLVCSLQLPTARTRTISRYFATRFRRYSTAVMSIPAVTAAKPCCIFWTPFRAMNCSRVRSQI